MIKMRKIFGLLLAACYIWGLASQLIMICPCSEHNSPIRTESPASDISACCSSSDYTSCCETGDIKNITTATDLERPGGCCASELNCHDCPLCLSSDLVLLINDNISIAPTFETTAINFFHVDLSASSDYSSIVDHPPDRIRLACHISTTVLRC